MQIPALKETVVTAAALVLPYTVANAGMQAPHGTDAGAVPAPHSSRPSLHSNSTTKQSRSQ